jgi:outer membrane cobalamin receptor
MNRKLSYALFSECCFKGEVFLAGENLIDRDYEYQPGYPMSGITRMVGVSFRF